MIEPEIMFSDSGSSVAYWPTSIAEIRRPDDDTTYDNTRRDCVVAPERALNDRGWAGHRKSSRDWGPEGADKWWGWYGDEVGTMPLSEAPPFVQDEFWERLNLELTLDI